VWRRKHGADPTKPAGDFSLHPLGDPCYPPRAEKVEPMKIVTPTCLTMHARPAYPAEGVKTRVWEWAID
jgi:hypothetical protein